MSQTVTLQGPDAGPPGPTPNITANPPTTLAAGQPATASIDNTDPLNPKLSLGIPTGLTGATPQIGIGAITVGTPNVQNTGTATAPVLAFTLPPGTQGPPGISSQVMKRYRVFGDSWGAVTAQGAGAETISNAPTMTALVAQAFNLNPTGRWALAGNWSSGPEYVNGTYVLRNGSVYLANSPAGFSYNQDPATDGGVNWQLVPGMSGWSDSLGWDNFAIPGANLASVPSAGESITGQVTQYLADINGGTPSSPVAGSIPAGTVIHFQYTAINDNIENASASSFSWQDTTIADYVSLVQSLITAGATLIIVNTCPNVSNAPYMTANNIVSQFSASAASWNTKLAAAFASIPQVVIFDLNAVYQEVFANPVAFGFDMPDDSYSDSNVLSNPSLWTKVPWFDGPSNSLHPSGALHSVFAQAVGSFIAGLLTQGAQVQAALTALNVRPQGATPVFTTPATSGKIVPTSQFFAPLITSADPRLAFASAVKTPQLRYSKFCDFDNGQYPNGSVEPDAGWLQDKSGTGLASFAYQGGISSGLCRGAITLSATAANDRYGHSLAGAPVVSNNNTTVLLGPLAFTCRIALQPGSGDTLFYRGGFVDQLSGNQPANGVFLELEWTSGTETAKLIYASGGSPTAFAIPSFSWVNIAVNKWSTLTFHSDTFCQRWFIYQDGAFLGWTKFSALPVAALLLGQQFVKTASGGGASYLSVDFIGCSDEVSRA
jgi:phospholipase/lecithinase/hemolysin